MKKSELEQIIKEEIEAVINENVLQKGFGKAYRYLKRKIKGKPSVKSPVKPPLSAWTRKANAELRDRVTPGNKDYIDKVLRAVDNQMTKDPKTVYLLHDAPAFQLLKNVSKTSLTSLGPVDRNKANQFFKSTFTGNDRLQQKDIKHLIQLLANM